MSVIEIDDSIKSQSEQLKSKLESYQSAVVSGVAAVDQAMDVLKGKSYDQLTTNIHNKMNTQKNLLVQCQTLQEMINEYLDTMIETESSINFD